MLVVMDKIEELVEKLKDGDENAAQELILHFMPLARNLAQRFIRRQPNKASDLRGAAMLGLTQAVRWSAKGRLKDLNIKPYIIKTVQRFCRQFVEHDHLIRVPKDSWLRIISALKLDGLDDFEKEKVLDGIKSKWKVHRTSSDGEDYSRGPDAQAIAKDDPDITAEKELRELLQLTPFEEAAVELRLQSFNLREISKLLDIPTTSLFRIFNKLQRRYTKLQKRYPTLPKPPEIES